MRDRSVTGLAVSWALCCWHGALAAAHGTRELRGQEGRAALRCVALAEHPVPHCCTSQSSN